MIEYDLVMFLLILHHFGLQTHYGILDFKQATRLFPCPRATFSRRSAQISWQDDITRCFGKTLIISVCLSLRPVQLNKHISFWDSAHRTKKTKTN